MRILLITLTLWWSFNGFAQELVKKQSDVRSLIDQQERFINKPLKELLKEIKPPIKFALGKDAKDHGMPANITFKFVTHQEYLILKEVNKFPLTLIIYVKEEKIDWYDLSKRTKETSTSWTADDLRKYGDLTVIGIEVYGEATTDN